MATKQRCLCGHHPGIWRLSLSLHDMQRRGPKLYCQMVLWLLFLPIANFVPPHPHLQCVYRCSTVWLWGSNETMSIKLHGRWSTYHSSYLHLFPWNSFSHNFLVFINFQWRHCVLVNNSILWSLGTAYYAHFPSKNAFTFFSVTIRGYIWSKPF